MITQATITKYLDEDRSGRAGLKALRRVCSLRNTADEKLESELERRTLKWLRQAGLPDPEGQYEIPAEFTTYHPDHAYPAIKLAIESDGPVHLLPSVARFDRMRDMDLRSMGWDVIRITATMTPPDVMPYIVKALKRQAA